MKVAVGLSGGVDSAVAALRLRSEGCEVVGFTMTLGRDGDGESLEAARSVAAQLSVPLTVVDFANEWREKVLDEIARAYRNALTPNPCVICNESVKFGLLPRSAFAAGCDMFATGHYARLEGGVLSMARDAAKDQSYFLYRVASDVRERTVLPLGDMTKAEVRALARSAALVVADRGDSQDFCGGDPREFARLEDREGEIVDVRGRVLARHRGCWHFTVGQRKGLGIGGGGTVYFVLRLDAAANRVVVARREESLVREFALESAVWHSDPTGELEVKVRSAGAPRGPVTVCGGVCHSPLGLFGVAPGQSAVFYRGGRVIGGAFISKAS